MALGRVRSVWRSGSGLRCLDVVASMSMQISARQERIDAQCGIDHPRYIHKPTGRRYMLAFEVAGLCELQGIDGRSTYAKRAELESNDVWELIP